MKACTMNIVFPTAWLRNLSLFSRQPVKRTPVIRPRWGHHTESLEDRALLSATALTTDHAAAAVAPIQARAAVQFPQVTGTWDIDVDGIGAGTATLTQKGARVVASIDIPGIGEFEIRGRFKRSSPDEISGTKRILIPELGRVRVHADINFPSGTINPTTFTGSVEAGDLNFTFTGTKQTSNPQAPAAARVTLPQVSGAWTVTASAEGQGSLTGVLNVTQNTSGRVIKATIDPISDVSLSLTGRFRGQDTATIRGTAVLKVNGSTYRAKFTVTLSDDRTQFSGTATVRIPGPDPDLQVSLQGTRLINI